MEPSQLNQFADRLKTRKQELDARLERVNQNLRQRLSQDSEERATETENSEVVDALGNEAREELAQVIDALHRMTIGTYGNCIDCNENIREQRLEAFPYARRCVECANLAEKQ